jgi:hypothetical protein
LKRLKLRVRKVRGAPFWKPGKETSPRKRCTGSLASRSPVAVRAITAILAKTRS